MMAHACNFKKVMTTYLSQSVNGLIGMGTETPHLSGRPEMAPKSRQLMVLARLLMHRHAARRSALVLASLLSERTPLQRPGVSLPLPVVYGSHDTRFESTCSHVITAEASHTSGAANKATTRTCLCCQSCHRPQFRKSTCRSPLCQGRCG
jgi:hypothetical protein